MCTNSRFGQVTHYFIAGLILLADGSAQMALGMPYEGLGFLFKISPECVNFPLLIDSLAS
jgi:hypothetical protein